MIDSTTVSVVQLGVFDLNGYMRCYTRIQMQSLVSCILIGDSHDEVMRNYAPFQELLSSVAKDVQSYHEGLRICEYPSGMDSIRNTVLLGEAPAFQYALDAMNAWDDLVELRKKTILGYLAKIECHRKYYPVIEKNRQALIDIATGNDMEDTLEAMRILTESWEGDPGQGIETMRTRSVLSTMREQYASIFSSYSRKMCADLGYIETFEFLRARVQGAM